MKDNWRIAPHSKELPFIPTPIVESYPLLALSLEHPELHNYLEGRGIGSPSYTRFGIRAGHKGDLAFPFTNIHGNVMGLVFRNVVDKTIRGLHLTDLEEEGFVFPSRAKTGAWFGLHLLNITDWVIVVEGEIDAMRVYDLGWDSVISPGGTGVSKQQAATIYNKKIYIGFDSDEAGKTGAKRLAKLWKDKRVKLIDWNVVGAKDPGELENVGALAVAIMMAEDYHG